MVSFARVCHEIKHQLTQQFSPVLVTEACRSAGLKWRRRVLSPVITLQVFILQLLHGNAALRALPRLAGVRFTAGAYCQARRRLPLAVLRHVLHTTGAALATPPGTAPATPAAAGRWHGHRVWLVDGSSCSMPDTAALRKRFGQPTGQKPGCGFPVAHLLVLFEAYSGALLDVLISPWHTGDMARVAELHRALAPGDVLVMDAAFGSYAHLALLTQQGVHGVVRLRRQQIVDFRPHRPAATPAQAKGRPRSTWLARCGFHDQLVQWHRPATVSRTMTPAEHAALPAYLPVRELRYRVRTRGFRSRVITLATTLLDPDTYAAEALADLYRQRWQVEGHLRELKQTLGLKVLHSQTVTGVEKEIVVFALVYNLVRARMLTAARTQGVSPARISFLDALRALRWAAGAAPPTPATATLLVNPLRPNRYEPRVRKRRPLEYSLMTQPRTELRKALRNKPVAA